MNRFRHVRSLFALSLLAGLLVWGASPASAAQGRLIRHADAIPGRYIVVLRPSAATRTDAMVGEVRRSYHASVGMVFHAALPGFVAHMTRAQASDLSRNPSVAYVEQDTRMHAYTTQSPATWGLDRIDQRSLPLDNSYSYTSDGAGVTAYVIDTGIRFSHQEFGGRAISGFDAIDGGTADDCNGHGTHVSGTIGGSTYGVAKAVTLVGVRVLNCQGSGTTSQVVAGIDWVTQDHVTGLAVANMSLGGSASTALDQAVANSIADGVTYAIAAGNGDFLGRAQDACNTSPARVPTALTVSATNSTDTKPSFANYGTCVDLFAPGVSITSAWNTNDSATNTISGTSMATPHVTGAAALYLKSNPTATPADVSAGLIANATPGVVLNSGSGSPNLLLYTGSVQPTVPGAPTLSATAGNQTVHLSWTVPLDGGSPITGYNVYRGTLSGQETLLTTLPSQTSFDDAGLVNGTTYYYRVSAVYGVDEGPRSNEVLAIPATVPGVPVLTATTATSNKGVQLTWSTPASDGGSSISGYRIYRSKTLGFTPGPATFVVAVGNVTGYKDTATKRGTVYYYRVTAVNPIGEGLPSNEASAKAK